HDEDRQGTGQAGAEGSPSGRRGDPRRDARQRRRRADGEEGLMATLKPELKTILDRYGIDPRDKSAIWDCHGTLVLYHKAYEIIAAKESIRFDPPVIIEGSAEKKTVAMLVVGHRGDRSDWSIGEAAPGNNKNSYP